MFGGAQRYQAAYEAAERDFAEEQAQYQRREKARQRDVAAARAKWEKAVGEARNQATAHNAEIAQLQADVREHDRFAVSRYVQMVLDRSPYPKGFPAERYAGYVPESSLLAVEWYLPTFAIIPENKSFRHVKQAKEVRPVAMPLAEAQRLYNAVIAQIAVRTVCEVFAVTSRDMVSTVVFNCMAYKADPVAPMKIAVQAKLYKGTVSPRYVRDPYGTMQHEGATLGILITTSGYGPSSVEFANGKPLQLIDGPGLISICQEHGIPARILGLGTRKPKK